MGGSGDAAKKTQEQIAIERRQRMQLNEETAASERRLKATARGKLGKRSLLGQPMQPVTAPTGPLITEGYAISGAKADKGQMYKKPTNGRGRGTGMRTGRMDK